MKMKNESMSKFDKSVALAKIQIEKSILEDANVFYRGAMILPITTEDLFLHLGSDWVYNLLINAGYSGTTAYRKMMNFDYDKLISKLDSWYLTELRPKLYKQCIDENRGIITLELKKKV